MQIRKDLTVIMVAPKSPGTEVREEYKRGFGVPTLIAVHRENDPKGEGWELAKAYACGTGGDRAGVLESSFVAEVKSDLMGEQTILCGMLQAGSLLCFDKMIEKGIESGYASKLIQYGWETITEALKHGGITNMMDRLSNPAKIKAFDLAEELKEILAPLFAKHMDDIMSGHFSRTMMEDWANNDKNLLKWRAATGKTAFEKSASTKKKISEQEYFDHGILMVAMVKAGVELAFDTMVSAGIKEESAYYESLHEVPLIANLISRKKLYEMNVVISDTAEYGCYLFAHAAVPMLAKFMKKIDTDVIGKGLARKRQRGEQHRAGPGQRGDPLHRGRGDRGGAALLHGGHEAHSLIPQQKSAVSKGSPQGFPLFFSAGPGLLRSSKIALTSFKDPMIQYVIIWSGRLRSRLTHKGGQDNAETGMNRLIRD